jgi:hypothetical protein
MRRQKISVQLFLMLLIFLILTIAAFAGGISVDLKIKSKLNDNEFVFLCKDNYNSDSYSWFYGDGNQKLLIKNKETTHIFKKSGTYKVKCIAHRKEIGIEKSGIIEVNVLTGNSKIENDLRNSNTAANPSVDLIIKPPYPKKNEFVFICDDEFDTKKYSWFYGDGEKQIEIMNRDTFHRYKNSGNYEVKCVSHKSGITKSGKISVIVDDLVNNPSVDLKIKAYYPKKKEFVFVCDDNFKANKFSWWYGDGEKQIRIKNRDTFHRYKESGTYNVKCEAIKDGFTLMNAIIVTIENFNNGSNQGGGSGQGSNGSGGSQGGSNISDNIGSDGGELGGNLDNTVISESNEDVRKKETGSGDSGLGFVGCNALKLQLRKGAEYLGYSFEEGKYFSFPVKVNHAKPPVLQVGKQFRELVNITEFDFNRDGINDVSFYLTRDYNGGVLITGIDLGKTEKEKSLCSVNLDN